MIAGSHTELLIDDFIISWMRNFSMLQVFLGVILNMGIRPHPNLQDFFLYVIYSIFTVLIKKQFLDRDNNFSNKYQRVISSELS